MMDKLKELITQYVEVDPDTITRDSRFIEDLGFNSYDIMCMLGDAETEFDAGAVTGFAEVELVEQLG